MKRCTQLLLFLAILLALCIVWRRVLDLDRPAQGPEHPGLRKSSVIEEPPPGNVHGQLTFSDPRGLHTAPHKPRVPPFPLASHTLPDDVYLPPLPAALAQGQFRCSGLGGKAAGPPVPVPDNPRFLLLADAWEQQDGALLALEEVVQLCKEHGLVLVMPFVRNALIQGVPGWTQWRSGQTQFVHSFTAAKKLLPGEEWIDMPFLNQFLPVITFKEFARRSNSTITSVVHFDYNHNCDVKPEWYPAFGAEVMATQRLCLKPQTRLDSETLGSWFEKVSDQEAAKKPLPEAEGRESVVPSAVILNWRRGVQQMTRTLDMGCRVRYTSKWKVLADEFRAQTFPRDYVAIRISTQVFNTRPGLSKCFALIAKAVQYYSQQLGHQNGSAVYLSTDWPQLPEGRWNYALMAELAAHFNALQYLFNVQQYRNRGLDEGVQTLVQAEMLAGAAVIIGWPDLPLQKVVEYFPGTKLAAFNMGLCPEFPR